MEEQRKAKVQAKTTEVRCYIVNPPGNPEAIQNISYPNLSPQPIVPEVVKPVLTFQRLCQPPIVEQIVDPGITVSTPPPYLNFVTFNRLGLTFKNLNNILQSDDNFELHITDCSSQDNTWDYIKSLKDDRIKSRIRFENNLGQIYANNYNLTKRKPDQYFFTIDSDVNIKTKNWLRKYMQIFENFPEVGLLGITRDNPYPRFMPPITPRFKNNVSYLELKNAQIDTIMDFIPGCLQGLRPELIKQIGYWSEESGYGDAEISPRIVHYTPFKVGFVTDVEIDMTQSIDCNQCGGQTFCKLHRSVKSCFTIGKTSNVNESFASKFKWKYLECFKELEQGKRTAFCASVFDPVSRMEHVYHEDWALENFMYYYNKSNP